MSHMISWTWFIYNESSFLSHIEFGLLYSTTLTTFLFLFSHWINPISALWLVDLISAFALEQISSTLFQFTCDSFPWVIRMTHWWIIRWLTSVTTVTCSGALNHHALWCYFNELNCRLFKVGFSKVHLFAVAVKIENVWWISMFDCTVHITFGFKH